MQVSHETIYLSLFVQSRGVLKQYSYGTSTSKDHASRPACDHGRPNPRQIVDALSIRERPASVEDRAIPGHWEGDLLAGKSNSHIATLVERHSRFVMLVRLPGKDTTSVVRALTRRVRALPRPDVIAHLGSRNGTGRAQGLHRRNGRPRVLLRSAESLATGTNENTNGLLRQYFPEGTDLSTYTQANLNAVARRLNMRPRKTLAYNTPADTLAACVASTP